jgi:hypothetical protein
VGNKADLEESMRIREEDVASFARAHSSSYRITSAKTGENVKEAFRSVAKRLVGGRR